MTLLLNQSTEALWRVTVQDAEVRCHVTLAKEVESYLIDVLNLYTSSARWVNQALAMSFLDAIQLPSAARTDALKQVGDQCLLYAGLFPKSVERKLISLRYLVDLGQSSYGHLSRITTDLFSHLSQQFVILMDVLQSIREENQLLPLEAYEQWQELGSQRAYAALRQYTQGIPIILFNTKKP